MARERHVFPTDEVPHKWAHQTQGEARNPQGNLFFQDATIYSYRHSWPLATIHANKRGRLVLTNSNTYSSTTAGHQFAVNRACSHLASVAVPDVRPADYAAHLRNVDYLKTCAADDLDRAGRMLHAGRFEYRERQARERQADINTYCLFFGVRRKVQAYAPAAWEVARVRIKRITNPDPVRDAKRFKEKERRERARAARLETVRAGLVIAQGEKIAQWRAGGDVATTYTADYYALSRADRREVGGSAFPMMLRIKGDQIETSRGARIPLDHAPRIWRVVRAVMARGVPYEHNGHSEHAGDYRIDSIAVDGTMRAGCHVIPFSELQALAVALGLPQ